MAELKSFSSCRIYRAVDQVEWKAGDIDNLHLDDNLFYSKSEVDAVLDEKDKIIAELKEQYNDMDIAHTVHIAKMNARIEELEESQRWRKFSEEKPKEKQWILVYYPNHSNFTTGVEVRRWDEGCKYDVEQQEVYDKWMPLLKAPEDV